MLKIITFMMIAACTRTGRITVAQPSLQQSTSFEKFEEPAIVECQKGYICMTPADYEKDLQNYRKSLKMIELYRVEHNYYK